MTQSISQLVGQCSDSAYGNKAECEKHGGTWTVVKAVLLVLSFVALGFVGLIIPQAIFQLVLLVLSVVALGFFGRKVNKKLNQTTLHDTLAGLKTLDVTLVENTVNEINQIDSSNISNTLDEFARISQQFDDATIDALKQNLSTVSRIDTAKLADAVVKASDVEKKLQLNNMLLAVEKVQTLNINAIVAAIGEATAVAAQVNKDTIDGVLSAAHKIDVNLINNAAVQIDRFQNAFSDEAINNLTKSFDARCDGVDIPISKGQFFSYALSDVPSENTTIKLNLKNKVGCKK
jgi:hypothetical protein